MNIIYPIKKQYSNLIFNHTKPYEFRNMIPKELNVGDIVFVYETKTTGCGKVIGYFEVGAITKIDYKLSKIGTYYHMDDYARMFCDEYTQKMIEKAKQIRVENYNNAIVMSYLFQDEKLDYMLENSKLPDNPFLPTHSIEYKKYNEAKKKEHEFCDKCDKWLTDIGFYNEYDESTWKYEITIKNPTLFERPIDITWFKAKNEGFVKVPPQGFCYTRSFPSDLLKEN